MDGPDSMKPLRVSETGGVSTLLQALFPWIPLGLSEKLRMSPKNGPLRGISWREER